MPFDRLRMPFDKLRMPFDKLRMPFDRLRVNGFRIPVVVSLPAGRPVEPRAASKRLSTPC